MSTHEEGRALLETAEAIVSGHFILNSGRHGNVYVDKDRVSIDPARCDAFARAAAAWCVTEGLRVDAVLAPAVGAIAFGQAVARELSRIWKRQVLAVFAEKQESGKDFAIRRSLVRYVQGKDLLLVEDILTTGGSAARTKDAALSAGGHIAGVYALCNRVKVTAEQLGVARAGWMTTVEEAQTWTAEECPLCREKVPFNLELGHAKSQVS